MPTRAAAAGCVKYGPVALRIQIDFGWIFDRALPLKLEIEIDQSNM